MGLRKEVILEGRGGERGLQGECKSKAPSGDSV